MSAEEWTPLPAIILSYDADTQLATVQPLIKQIYKDGSTQDLPEVYGVPIWTPRTAYSGLMLPVKKGDKILLIFTMRSLDNLLETDISGYIAPEQVDPEDNKFKDYSFCVGLAGFHDENSAIGTNGDVRLLNNWEGTDPQTKYIVRGVDELGDLPSIDPAVLDLASLVPTAVAITYRTKIYKEDAVVAIALYASNIVATDNGSSHALLIDKNIIKLAVEPTPGDVVELKLLVGTHVIEFEVEILDDPKLNELILHDTGDITIQNPTVKINATLEGVITVNNKNCVVTVLPDGTVNIDAHTVNMTGDLNVEGHITGGNGTFGGINVPTHIHTGDDGGNTSRPQ